tara:strand:+ start:74826 stop:76163 length:1338 start_codon:yes stop_codon:yes gene_type:complete
MKKVLVMKTKDHIKLLSRRFLNRLKRPVSNRQGIALIMTLAALNVILPLALDLAQVTTLEYSVSTQSVNRIRAYYAARAGAELGLLRILLYQKAKAQVGDKLGEQGEILDLIWQFPFEWPPTIPDGLNAVERSQIEKNTEESFMKSKFFLSIEDEGQKIDINALGSPSKRLATATRNQILQIFEDKIQNDDGFEERYGSTDFEELIDNITDWVDVDDQKISGGAESTLYSVIEDAGQIPPSAPFRTMDEIKLVAGMNPEFYRILKDRVTIYGVSGINVNSATKAVLIAIDAQIDEEVADQIITRRNDKDAGGTFKNEDEFLEFLDTETNVNTEDFNEAGMPLFFGEKYNFRIVSTGQEKNTYREIQAVTYDFDSLKENLVTLLDEQAKEDGQNEDEGQGDDQGDGDGQGDDQGDGDGQGDSGSGTTNTPQKTIQGRPQVVHWSEH